MRAGKRLARFLGAALCAMGLAMATATAQETKSVSFALSSTGMLYTPVYAADVLGYFEEEGISIELQTMSASAIMPAVIRGNVDIYPGTAVAVLRAASEGADVRVLGALINQYASNVVINGEKARELGLDENSTVEERIAALRGMNIAIAGMGSGTHQLALYLFDRVGLDTERDATLTFMTGSREMLAAFELGRIDAFFLSNPTSDTAVRDLDGFLLLDMANGAIAELDGYPYVTLITRGDWVEEDVERSGAVLRAIERAMEAIKDPARTEDVRDLVHEGHLNQFEKGLFDVAWENMAQAYPDSPLMSPDMVLRAIEYLNQFSETPLDPALAEAILVREHRAAAN